LYSILFFLLHDVNKGETAKLSVGGWRRDNCGLGDGEKGRRDFRLQIVDFRFERQKRGRGIKYLGGHQVQELIS
jgi:hypothetical protein